MNKSKIIHRLIQVLLVFIAAIILSSLVTFIGIQGLINSDPRVAIIMGKSITGTVISKDRAYGFAVTVSTEGYGDIQVACPVDKYMILKEGDHVALSYEITLEE